MGKFLKALSKIGLVELDSDERSRHDLEAVDISAEVDAEIAEFLGSEDTAVHAAVADPPSADPAVPAVPTSTEVEEGQAFDLIYAQAQVPASPFPAEKMLRVLEGLSAMDAHTRKTAILAMDAADEAWTIEDPLLDADRKTRALEATRGELAATMAASEAKAEQDLAAQEDFQTQAVEEIRKQIAELEAMMNTAMSEAAEEKAAIRARLEATRGAVARETARMDGEIARMKILGKTFGEAGQTPAGDE